MKRSGRQHVTLVGLRAGATVAALVADNAHQLVDRLVLWAPVVDGSRYMQDLLRMNLTTQIAAHKEIQHDREALAGQMQQGQTVNVDGYEMAWPLFSQFSAVRLADASKQFAGRCLVVQVDRRPRPDAELQKLVGTYGERAVFALAEEELFWKEIPRFYERAMNLFRITQEWLG